MGGKRRGDYPRETRLKLDRKGTVVDYVICRVLCGTALTRIRLRMPGISILNRVRGVTREEIKEVGERRRAHFLPNERPNFDFGFEDPRKISECDVVSKLLQVLHIMGLRDGGSRRRNRKDPRDFEVRAGEPIGH